IVVRRARRGEPLTTLDGQDRALDEGILVIADPRRAIAIAGVMGGRDTEVTERTTRVLLEGAYFQPASIRRTSRGLGLATDAAYRFERGADIEALRDALDRAAQLIADVAGGAIARGVVDAYPAPRRRPAVRLRMSRLRRIVGASPPVEEVTRILEGLCLPVLRAGEDLEVEVPSFRRDIAIEDDLVEEVIRVWGYDRIPATLPAGSSRSASTSGARARGWWSAAGWRSRSRAPGPTSGCTQAATRSTSTTPRGWPSTSWRASGRGRPASTRGFQTTPTSSRGAGR